MVVGPHYTSWNGPRYDNLTFTFQASSRIFSWELKMTEGETTSTGIGGGDASQLTTIPPSGNYIMKIESKYLSVQSSDGTDLFLITDAESADDVPQGNILIIAEDYTDVSGTIVRSNIIQSVIDDLNSDRTIAAQQEVVIAIIG